MRFTSRHERAKCRVRTPLLAQTLMQRTNDTATI